MKNQIKITLSVWTDVVSPESASDGDYERTGEDMSDYDLSDESIESIASDFISELKSMSIDFIAGYVNEVLYCTDASIDYENGEESYKRLYLFVDSDGVNTLFKASEIRGELEKEITRQLAA